MPRAAKANPKQAAAKKPRAPKNTHQLAPPLPEGLVLTDAIKKQWKVGKSIGSGGFGLLYLASPANEACGPNAEYVLKVEPYANGPLFCELHFYQRAAKKEMISQWMSAKKLKTLGVPKYITSGIHDDGKDKYRFMIMERFGTDLQKVFESNGKRFSRDTVMQLAISLLNTLEYMHNHEYVHADVKASNILMGFARGTENQAFLVDFGLAYRYLNDGRHKEYNEDPRRAHDGTIEFTSRDAHRGVFPSRRADLEITGYCLLQWMCGKLPWENNLENKDYVRDQKMRYMDDIDGLMRVCFPRGDVPGEIKAYLEEVSELEYEEEPDYEHLRQIFKKAAKSLGYNLTGALNLAAPSGSPKKAPAKKGTKRRSTDDHVVSDDSPPKRAKKSAPADPTSPAERTPAKKVAKGGARPKAKARVSASPAAKKSPLRTSTNGIIPRPQKPPLVLPPARNKSEQKRPTPKKVSHKLLAKASVATQTSPGLKGLPRSWTKKGKK